MKYPVGKLLTREYNDIERRILQARLIRNTNSWANTIRFVCVDGKVGFKDVDYMEEFEIADLVTRVRIAPYIQYLFMQEDKKDEPNYARITQMIAPNKMPITGQDTAILLKKYKWLYATETWEGEK